MRAALVLLLTTLAVSAAPPEPLLLYRCEATSEAAGGELETANVQEGRGALRWRNHPQTPSLSFTRPPADWSGYHLLRFQLHNAVALPASFMVLAASENPDTEGPDYYGWQVPLNFTGWREITLPLTADVAARSPRGFKQIDSLTFSSAGWGQTPNPQADLLVDDLRLVYDPPRPGPRMTDAEFFAALDLTRPELAAVQTAVGQGDLAAARQALLQHFRSRPTPRWWFDWRDRPQRQPVTGGSDGWDYYGTSIKLDFSGWRTIRLPLAQFGASRQPIGWHQINDLQLSATYNDRRPDPATRVILDQIRLEGPTGTTVLADFESPADLARWPGLAATTEQVKSGRQAALWASLDQRGSIRSTPLRTDWSKDQALVLELWCAQPGNDVLTVIAESDTPNLKGADDVCRHLFGGFALGDDIDWTINKLPPTDPAFTREWTYSLNRFPHWNTLGDAYWASGDEKYAREWIAQMRDWVEDHPYLLTGTGNNTLTWRTIEAGIRCSGSWPTALYRFLGSPSLTAEDLVVFLKSWIEHGHHLMRITVEHPEHGGNWVTMECNGLGHLGLLLPEARDAALWQRTAADRMAKELDAQVYPDGTQKELTTGYHQVARSNFVGLQKFAAFNGQQLAADYIAKLERMYRYNLLAMTPDGCLPPLNDAGYTAVLDSLKEAAELYGSDDYAWAASGGVSGQPPRIASVAFPYAGQYIMRSGWGRDDRYALFESGPYGTGHQHEDMLSIFLYGLGRVLLTEGGTYSYDASKYRRYVLGTWAHNTALVDGQGQQRGRVRETYETAQPCANLWASGQLFDAADGRYEWGYGNQRDIAVPHERTVVFVKPDYWVVLDRFLGAGPHRYDVLWNLNNQRAEQDASSRAAWGSDAAVANLLVVPSRAAPQMGLDIVVGREDPPLGFAPASRRQPVPCLDYQFSGTGPQTVAWVLRPFRGQRPAVTVSCRDEQGGTLIEVRADGGVDRVWVAPRGLRPQVELDGFRGQAAVVVSRRGADGSSRIGGTTGGGTTVGG
ncbi:MAG: alginate lyase family protein [Fimbriimonadaceae bacterium]|nr:alginate lyase family protein [Fimbriimonadaceae bacterium]